MSWNDPTGFNWEAGKLVFGAFLDAYLRDNLNETAPAKVTTKGDLVVADGANSIERLAVGADGQVLTADAAEALGVKWAASAVADFEDEIDAKGDLLVGFVDDDGQRLAVGSDAQSLVADAGETLGVRWSPVPWEAVLLDAFCRNFGEMDVRGLWVANSPYDRVYDPSRELTMNAMRGRFDESNPVGYWDYVPPGAFVWHADHVDFDVTGELTLGGWFWANDLGANYRLITKWLPTGNQRSYAVLVLTTGVLETIISVDGSATDVHDSTNTIGAGAWFFGALRFNPSTETAVFLNGTWSKYTVGIPASIFDGTADFRIGAEDGPTAELDGRVASAFIVAGLGTDAEVEDYFDRTRPVFGV